jgi:7,8-dihydropterin-6-yl-methyl-4-(beta-D-ribofuranosyl)aminobenzene 5'-phosphate synthase
MSVTITIVYDNTAWDSRLRPDWGFSCLVEAHGRKILFDTGADGSILMGNLRLLGISPSSIDAVFISHSHVDHMGGLIEILKAKPSAPVFVPAPLADFRSGTVITKGITLYPGFYSTGTLTETEHALVVACEGGVVAITGCSHPGVEAILKATREFGRPCGLIGGFHAFNRFEILNDLDVICPAHCTAYTHRIRSLYPDKVVSGGTGKVLEIP